MSSPSAVADLLAALAYRLHNGDLVVEDKSRDSSSSMGLAISELNRSLSLDIGGKDSGVKVLDATLSLMCFKAPQVFDSAVEYLVRTIVYVLSPSISCRVLRSRNEETLQFGSSKLPQCSEELIEISKDIIDKLGANGRLATMLLQAVVRSAASTSCIVNAHRKLLDGTNRGVSKLLAYLPRESPIENDQIPLRILFWYQDPMSLKEDVSRILKDVVERPFLCLKKELFERSEWRGIVIYLALSPTMFINARALLHKWFLLTGLVSVFEVLVGLVSAIMDTISRPSFWGIPIELAPKLPFADAYFPFQCQFLKILAGPLTSESLVMLAHTVRKPFAVPGQQRRDTNCKPIGLKAQPQAVDEKTEWALAMNFPDWFYFASAMLFSEGNSLENIHLRYSSQGADCRQVYDEKGLSIAAATYISWILNPVTGTIQESLSKSLIRVSEMCTSKSCGSEAHSGETIIGKRKKRDRPVSGKKKASSTVEDVLREFENKVNSSVSNEIDSQKPHPLFSSGIQSNILVRRVVVGILIGSPYSVTDEEYELVLHYAATGEILVINKKSQGAGFKQAKGISRISALLSNEITKEEAIEGIRLVFNLTDTLESMCISSFEAEEDAKEFINQFKLRSIKYLVKCIDCLIQLHCKEDGDSMLSDIYIGLQQWTINGREDPHFSKYLDDTVAKFLQILAGKTVII